MYEGHSHKFLEKRRSEWGGVGIKKYAREWHSPSRIKWEA